MDVMLQYLGQAVLNFLLRHYVDWQKFFTFGFLIGIEFFKACFGINTSPRTSSKLWISLDADLETLVNYEWF
jgi:hypothetical protein